jgi:hypothetical protein
VKIKQHLDDQKGTFWRWTFCYAYQLGTEIIV